jgi:hypothetical protein
MKKLISLTLSAASLAGAAALLSLPALAQYDQRGRYEQNGYVWEPGHWESSRGQQVWVEGRWVRGDDGYREPERRGYDERRDFDGRRRDREAQAREREAQAAREREAQVREREAQAARERAAVAAREAEAARQRANAGRAVPPVVQAPPPPVVEAPRNRTGEWTMTRDGDTGASMWVNSRTGQISYVEPK